MKHLHRIDREDRHGWRVVIRLLPLFRTGYDIGQDEFRRGWWFWSPSVSVYRRGYGKSTHGIGADFCWGMIPHPSARPWSNRDGCYNDEMKTENTYAPRS